jgi:glycine/D-amino acid oxidase-like deaminating enzyme
MRAGRTLALSVALFSSIGAPPGHADFEILLREGETVIAYSYHVEGDKLIAHQPAGSIEINFARVVNVRDRGNDRPVDPAASRREPKPAGAVEVAPTISAAPPYSPILTPSDARVRERELTRAIIVAYRDLLFAENRGETAADVERRRAHIAELEAERSSARKVIDGHWDPTGTDSKIPETSPVGR